MTILENDLEGERKTALLKVLDCAHSRSYFLSQGNLDNLFNVLAPLYGTDEQEQYKIDLDSLYKGGYLEFSTPFVLKPTQHTKNYLLSKEEIEEDNEIKDLIMSTISFISNRY